MPDEKRVPEPAATGPARVLRADARRNRIRILEAAEAVFATKGPSASTEEIAQMAGVGVGTVFRHFPTKESLLAAITNAVALRLAEETLALADEGDPATALFTFFTRVVEQAAEQKTIADLLAQAGVDVTVAKPVLALREAVEVLLARARQAGTVRPDVRVAEVMALLIGLCQAALHTRWDADLRARTLAIVFSGLRPAASAV